MANNMLDQVLDFVAKPFIHPENGAFKWWFRYPLGIALAYGVWWIANSALFPRGAQVWVLVGGWIAALAIMKELGCLVMVIALLGLAWVGIEWASSYESAKWWGIVIGIGLFLFQLFALIDRMDKLKKEVDSLKLQVNRLKNAVPANNE